MRAVILGGLLLGAGLAASALLSGRNRPRRALHPDSAGARHKMAGAFVLSASVLADSGIQHYRGSFFRSPMYLAPATAALGMAASSLGALAPDYRPTLRRSAFAAAIAIGAAGEGFHTYNLLKRPGRASWHNLFYGAPLGAPASLSVAGLLGLSADGGGPLAWLARKPRPQLAMAAAGLVGTVAEVAILHFRGAFHNRYMLVPLVVPTLAAAACGWAAAAPSMAARRSADALLASTALTGLLGLAFHSYGIHRNMGGWANASQNVLNGPPIGAPPGFTAIALGGLGALAQLEEGSHG